MFLAMSFFSVPQVQQLLLTSPAVTITMALKRAISKETTGSSNGEVVEKPPVEFPMYTNTQLFIEKGSSLTWKHVKDVFAKEFEADLED